MLKAAAAPPAGIRLADLLAKATQEALCGGGGGTLGIFYSVPDADLLLCKEVADYMYGEVKSKLSRVSVNPPVALTAAPPGLQGRINPLRNWAWRRCRL